MFCIAKCAPKSNDNRDILGQRKCSMEKWEPVENGKCLQSKLNLLTRPLCHLNGKSVIVVVDKKWPIDGNLLTLANIRLSIAYAN